MDKKQKSKHQKFKEDWINTFMEKLDTQLSESERIKLMVSCGRECASRHMIQRIQTYKGEIEKFVNVMAGHLGKENSFVEDGVVHWGYNKCLCHLVDQGPDRLSETFCHCSKGWILEVFETITGNPVKVDILQTIKRGASSCQFLIYL